MQEAAAEIDGLKLEHQHACQEIAVAAGERDEWKARALAAEARVRDVRAQTIEECAALSEKYEAPASSRPKDVDMGHQHQWSTGEARDAIAAAIRSLAAKDSLVAVNGWRPIDSAPRDGTIVDLWIVGGDMVKFYCNVLRQNAPGQYEGRACDFRWIQHKPNPPGWHPVHGLNPSFPLSPEVKATHWMAHPRSPAPQN